MNPMTICASAVALATLFTASGAIARDRAEVVLSTPATKPMNALIEAERWRCDGAACSGAINVLPGRLDGPLAISVCRQIARKAGRVQAMTMAGAALSPASLAKCNEGTEAALTLVASGR